MMTFRSHAWVLVPFILMLLTAPASGDEITLRFDSSMYSNFRLRGDPVDVSDASITTYPGSSKLKSLCCKNIDGLAFTPSFPILKVPFGQTILSAKMTLSFAHELQYSYEPAPMEVPPPLDPNQPSLAGRMLATVITRNSVVYLAAGQCELLSSNNFQGLNLVGHGCDPLVNGELLVWMYAISTTEIVPTVIDPGFNAETRFYVTGGNGTPISGELDVIYGPSIVPEPLPVLLIGTGMLLVARLALRHGADRTAACIH